MVVVVVVLKNFISEELVLDFRATAPRGDLVVEACAFE